MIRSIGYWTGALLALATASSAVAQNTYNVTSTAPNGPGSLAAAVSSMQFNGTLQTIRFQLPANSVITLAANLPNLVGSSVEVLGTDTPGLVIDGAGSHSIFSYGGNALVLRGLTLRNARSTTAACLRSSATLSTQVFDTRFINCRTDGTSASGSGGGAISSTGGSLLLTRTRFEGNVASDGGIDNLALGGGAVSFSGGSLQIEDSVFSGNYTLRTERPAGGCFDGSGGAVSAGLIAGASVLLRGVEFTANAHRCGSPTGSISGQAGALSISGPGSGAVPIFTIESSFFGGNRAFNGAGIFARAVRLNINNTSFHDNVATSFGAGAILLTSGFGSAPPIPELNLTSTTFLNNGGAGGADLALVATSGARLRSLRNVIFGPTASGNSCAPGILNADAGASNFVAGADCVAFLPGGEVITVEFAADNTFGLLPPANNGGPVPTLDVVPGSVPIDNGSNTGCPLLDARGFRRPFDGDGNGGATCDVGAIEYRPEILLRDGFES